MDKKQMDTLRTMLCGELEDITKKGISDHETLDVLKDLLDATKNTYKIEKYKKELEEKEKENAFGDMGYSQRSMGRYYVDGEYDRGNSWRGGMDNSYRGGYGGYDMGNSYRGYPTMYDMGSSYRYDAPVMGYSGARDDLKNELRKMMAESTDEKTRATLSEVMNKVG